MGNEISKWDLRFLDNAEHISTWSKDPRLKVGCVIIDNPQDRNMLAGGYNGFPRGVEDTDERLNDKDLKNQLVVHAEINGVVSAARRLLKGSTGYVNEHICVRCAVVWIQAGIVRIVFRKRRVTTPISAETQKDYELARYILQEANIEVLEIF